jgi:hypothetical protein
LITLRFERPQSAAQHLLQLGHRVEILEPGELRQIMADNAYRMTALYPTRPETSAQPVAAHAHATRMTARRRHG